VPPAPEPSGANRLQAAGIAPMAPHRDQGRGPPGAHHDLVMALALAVFGSVAESAGEHSPPGASSPSGPGGVSEGLCKVVCLAILPPAKESG
jgi:hypothetical protein